jgi:AbrB family looped-hinge helix DNA binding protein
METVVSSKGQVVIPSALRRKYDIKKGTKVDVTDRDGRIVLEPVNRRTIHRLRGLLKGTGALEGLMAERARDREKEDEGSRTR